MCVRVTDSASSATAFTTTTASTDSTVTTTPTSFTTGTLVNFIKSSMSMSHHWFFYVRQFTVISRYLFTMQADVWYMMDRVNDDNMMIYHESKIFIYSKYSVLCVCVTDSTTTTFSTPTASTVSTVTTTPTSFTTGTLVNFIKPSSSVGE